MLYSGGVKSVGFGGLFSRHNFTNSSSQHPRADALTTALGVSHPKGGFALTFRKPGIFSGLGSRVKRVGSALFQLLVLVVLAGLRFNLLE